ncbi:MAG: CRISPR-associated endonuclease Cas2 [Pseudomonadota bacterium]
MVTPLSSYRIMWLYVMFDLPVGTKKERKQATMFRNDLLDMGFVMAQFSVYLKCCPSGEKAQAAGERVQRCLPPGGKVDILTITDKQYGQIRRFYGQQAKKKPPKRQQIHLF